MTTAIISPAMRRSADELLARSDRWARGVRLADSLPFVTFTSASKVGVFYFASERGCFCPGFRNRGKCCHVIAVAEDADCRSAALGLATDAQVDAIVGGVALKLNPDAGRAVTTYGPCISKNCTNAAVSKARQLADLDAAARSDVLHLLATEIRELPATE